MITAEQAEELSILAEQAEELNILALANSVGKFAIEIGFSDTGPQQYALERLLLRGLANHPGRLFRVFKAEPEAMTWFHSQEELEHDRGQTANP